MRIRTFNDSDTSAVTELWRASDLVRVQNDPDLDIQHKVADSPWGFLVALIDDRIVGSLMVGYDGHRGWVNYLACHPDFRRQGVASGLMSRAVELLVERGCPKLNLQVRDGNAAAVGFYESLGFSDDHVTSLGRRLIRDDEPDGAGDR